MSHRTDTQRLTDMYLLPGTLARSLAVPLPRMGASTMGHRGGPAFIWKAFVLSAAKRFCLPRYGIKRISVPFSHHFVLNRTHAPWTNKSSLLTAFNLRTDRCHRLCWLTAG